MKTLASRALLIALAALASATGSAGAATITFDTVVEGTTDPFSVVADGTTVSFDGAGLFVVGSPFPAAFNSLNNNVLFDSDDTVTPLNVNFGNNIATLSFNFALDTFEAATPFSLAFFFGATPVGSVTATGTVSPGFFFPEGLTSFSGPIFNRVVLSSTAQNFAIDNLEFTVAPTTAVPEPTSLVLFGTGVAGLIAKARRRRRLVIRD